MRNQGLPAGTDRRVHALISRAADPDAAPAEDELDDFSDLDDELDDETKALLQAFEELIAESLASRRAPWREDLHPRGPRGRFVSMVDRLKVDLKDHLDATTDPLGNKGPHPFRAYNREQLRRAAKKRGLQIPRGASRDHIAAALLEDLRNSTRPGIRPVPNRPKVAPKPRVPRKPKVDPKGFDTAPAKPGKPGHTFFDAVLAKHPAPPAPTKAHDGDHILGDPEVTKPPGPVYDSNSNRYHRDVSGHKLTTMRDTVEKQHPAKENMLAQGAMGKTELISYANGQQVVRKEALRKFGDNTPEMQAHAEQLSSLVLRALGLDAPRVYRSEDDNPATVHMEFVHDGVRPGKAGTLTLDGDSPGKAGPEAVKALKESPEGRTMALADTLILNGDRHGGNWFIRFDKDGDAHVIPIDNGLAFDKSYFGGLRGGWEVPRNYFSTQDIEDARKRLEKHRVDFQRLGRGDWFNGMMRRLDAQLERAQERAKKDRRLLPAK